jgi:CO dehydrogenase/acetyl-CoA synthase delta subunit
VHDEQLQLPAQAGAVEAVAARHTRVIDLDRSKLSYLLPCYQLIIYMLV